VGVQMSHPRTVIVGCDGKRIGDAALRFAATEARLRRARLVVVAGYDLPAAEPLAANAAARNAALQRSTYARTEAAMQRALGLPVANYFDIQIIVEDGDAAELLLAHAGNAVLIVVASHEWLALHRLLDARSAAAKRWDSVPVTVVPGEWQKGSY
jgi:universal stress protein family protein